MRVARPSWTTTYPGPRPQQGSLAAYVYGLHAYVVSGDPQRGARVAARLEAGRVLVNTLVHEPKPKAMVVAA